MRVDGVEGEYYFKVLFRNKGGGSLEGWQLTSHYFNSIEEVSAYFKSIDFKPNVDWEFKWPVEVNQDGYCLVPDSVA